VEYDAMGNLNLNSDEVILQKTQTLIINGVRHEGVLTGRRLILVTSGTGSIHEDILFAEIDLAKSGVNKLREPNITLNVNSPGGEKRTIELIFIRLDGNQNIAELEKCIAILREHHVPVEAGNHVAGPAFSGNGQRIIPGELTGEEQVSRPAVPELTPFGTTRQRRQPLPDETSHQSPLTVIAAVLFIIVVLIIGMVVAGQMLNGKNVPVNQSVTGSNITTRVVSSTSPTPRTQATSGTVSSAPALTVPKNGVWVLISYRGNFTGYIGAQGRQIGINSSGNQSYKLPFSDAMIEGLIEKEDGSPEKIEVGIYNGGTLVSKSETKKPWGGVDIHVKVGPAIGNPVVTATPVLKITISPYAFLPQASIPNSGVWVRVFYSGNFMGSIRANGLITNVNSTGDQFYQFPLASGTVDGSIGKQDGTADTLIIEVYKAGKLISQSYTATPWGIADINTRV
jgi:hypothetical protein